LLWDIAPPVEQTFENAINPALPEGRCGVDPETWRLPAASELIGLLNHHPESTDDAGNRVRVDQVFFPEWPISPLYWVNAANANDLAMALELSDGRLEAVEDDEMELAVRVSGIRRTYNLICGANPEKRFHTELDLPLQQPDGFPLNLEGQILDCNTGLVWKRCVEGFRWDGNACAPPAATSLFSWRQALRISRETNGVSTEEEDNFLSEPQAFGNSNWRVPNVKELQSLQIFDQDPKGSYLPFLDEHFSAPAGQFSYWSSTAANSRAAYQVRFGAVVPNNPQVEENWLVFGAPTDRASSGMVRLVRSLHP